MITLRLLLIVAFAAFVAGSTVGAGFIMKVYGYRAMKAEIAALKLDRDRYRKAVGFAQKIEDESGGIEITNEEIERAIAALVEKRSTPPVTVTASTPVSDPVCIDADSLRTIDRYR